MPAREHDPRADTSALFVRIPVAEAEKLDRAAFELKARKQDLVTELVARYVDPSSPSGLEALSRLGAEGTPEAGGGRPRAGDRRRVTVETADDSLAIGRHSFRPTGAPEVLTLAQVADLLEVAEEAVEALADGGQLPGRKIGSDWRFSRAAVLAWLGHDEPGAAERPGSAESA